MRLFAIVCVGNFHVVNLFKRKFKIELANKVLLCFWEMTRHNQDETLFVSFAHYVLLF